MLTFTQITFFYSKFMFIYIADTDTPLLNGLYLIVMYVIYYIVIWNIII